jgi:AcrR family transcriptional regulator
LYAARVARLPEHLSKVPVGREQLSREALSEHQRERVLIAATGVFAKRGYQATTIDNIVAAAKASVGSFYQLFDGKEDCFLGVYERILVAARERIAAAVSPADDWAGGALAGLGAVLEIFVAKPLEARIVLIEVQTAGPAATAHYNQLIDAATGWLRGGREHHPAAADLPATFEQAAVAGLAFYLQQRLLASEPQSVRSLLEDTAPMILEPIIGEAEFRRRRGELAAVPAG